MGESKVVTRAPGVATGESVGGSMEGQQPVTRSVDSARDASMSNLVCERIGSFLSSMRVLDTDRPDLPLLRKVRFLSKRY
jgi:hypothetical protein